MIVVTTGWRYVDIDAFGGCVALAELYRLQGQAAHAVLTGPLSDSVTPTIAAWPAEYDTVYTPNQDDEFVLVDVSEAEFFERFVDLDRVSGIVDHHPGFESLWQERLGDKAVIEPIGAACTLVAEAWEAAGLLDKISPSSAGLLMSGILDNTLNFGAQITSPRDHAAYEKLSRYAGLPDDWPKQYFQECQTGIVADLGGSLRRDYKEIDFSSYGSERLHVGQYTLWNVDALVSAEGRDILRRTFVTLPHGERAWFVNAISLADGASYLITDDAGVQTWLSRLLNVQFENGVARADRLWLRKEIIGADLARR